MIDSATADLGPGRARAQQMQRREMTLQVGEQQSLPATGVRSYSEGVAGIADIRYSRETNQFIILGQRPGQTSLLLIMDDGSQIQYRIVVQAEAAQTQGITERDNIRLDFYFVQVSDSYTHNIGVGWPAFIGGQRISTFGARLELTGPTLANATLAIANQPLPRLDLLQAKGWARIARQAALVTANGNEATFRSGGELNVRLVGGLQNSLATIRYGSEIKVLPKYDRETGRVELTVSAEVAELSDSAGGDFPGRVLSHVETLVNLEMGQAVMLAGIQADSQSQSASGLPGLSQIPVLGVLFGTNAARHEQTRNVLFIVPTVVDFTTQANRDIIGEAMRVYEEFSGNTEDVLLFEPIHGGAPRRRSPELPSSNDPPRGWPQSSGTGGTSATGATGTTGGAGGATGGGSGRRRTY
jgi:pilus assembly protein CpaC